MTKQLYLIDGSSYIYRAYFALPSAMQTSTGIPTNATYGFTNILVKVLNRYKPKYIGVVLDHGPRTFRNEMYPEYKANRHRNEASSDLAPQFSYCRKILDAFNLPAIELGGYEADDIVATMAERFSNEGWDVVVVSSDKDMMQLVCDDVKLLDTQKDLWITSDVVIGKFGVAPGEVTQVMGLVGDSADNIPGIRGVGIKTASTLIQHCGTLENLYADLPNWRTTGRMLKLLEEGKELAFLSRMLATVKRDVPIDSLSVTIEPFKGFDADKVKKLFKELEFTANLERVMKVK